VTFNITVNTFVRMCGMNVPVHTCEEYSVWVHKLGITKRQSRHLSQHSQTFNHPLQARSLSSQAALKLTYMNTECRVLRSSVQNQYKFMCLGS
jgi:hypothetical protein